MGEFNIKIQSNPYVSKIREATELKQTATKVGETTSGANFVDTLKGALNNVNDAQLASEKASKELAVGRAESLHQVMITMEKAEVALRTAVAVRNKILDAYHEIMKMPV